MHMCLSYVRYRSTWSNNWEFFYLGQSINIHTVKYFQSRYAWQLLSTWISAAWILTNNTNDKGKYMAQYDPGDAEDPHAIDSPQRARRLLCTEKLLAIRVHRKSQEDLHQTSWNSNSHVKINFHIIISNINLNTSIYALVVPTPLFKYCHTAAIV